MAEQIIDHLYKLKGGEQDAVERTNPFLERREPIIVYCRDGITRMKIGDGVHHYNDLSWAGGVSQSSSSLDEDALQTLLDRLQVSLDTKVDKVSGKGLSTNDYTTADKNKLSNIEDGATKVIVDNDSLSSDSTNAISNRIVKQALDNLENIVVPNKVNATVAGSLNEAINNIVLDGGTI